VANGAVVVAAFIAGLIVFAVSVAAGVLIGHIRHRRAVRRGLDLISPSTSEEQ
jgi:hypothetical protein